VIALTHMRAPNDRKLAKEVPQLDMILGGHDHSNINEMVEGVLLVKSGTDFEEFSSITMHASEATLSEGASLRFKSETKGFIFEVENVKIDTTWKPDPEIEEHVAKYTQKLDEDLDVVRIDLKLLKGMRVLRGRPGGSVRCNTQIGDQPG